MATGRIYYFEKRGVYQAIVENGCRDERGKRVQIFRDTRVAHSAQAERPFHGKANTDSASSRTPRSEATRLSC